MGRGIAWLAALFLLLGGITGEEELLVAQVAKTAVPSVAWAGSEDFLAATADDQLALLNATSGAPITLLRGHNGRLTTVTVSSNSLHVVSGGEDQTVRLWDVAAGLLLQTFSGHGGVVRHAMMLPSGGYILSCGADAAVILWNAMTGMEVWVGRSHTDDVTALSLAPNGTLALSGGRDGAAYLWAMGTGRSRALLDVRPAGILAVAFAPDAHLVAIAASDGYRLVDPDSGQVRSFTRAAAATSLAFSPDATHLALGQVDGAISIVDVGTARGRYTLLGHAGNVLSVAYSRDGLRLASSGQDGTVRLWHATRVDCQTEPWAPWPPCDCDAGLRRRVRVVLAGPANGGAECPELTQQQSCGCGLPIGVICGIAFGTVFGGLLVLCPLLCVCWWCGCCGCDYCGRRSARTLPVPYPGGPDNAQKYAVGRRYTRYQARGAQNVAIDVEAAQGCETPERSPKPVEEAEDEEEEPPRQLPPLSRVGSPPKSIPIDSGGGAALQITPRARRPHSCPVGEVLAEDVSDEELPAALADLRPPQPLPPGEHSPPRPHRLPPISPSSRRLSNVAHLIR